MDEKSPHILLVDDEQAIVSVMKQQLEIFGCRVSGFTSSRDALRAFTEQPAAFDLLITDQVMPVLTGLELAKEIVRIRPELPVLLISGFADTRILIELRQHGMHAFLAKPHTSQELKQTVDVLLGRR